MKPLSYLGVDSPNPPKLYFESRIPLASDNKLYTIGDMWIVKANAPVSAETVWILTSLALNTATWTQLNTGAADVNTLSDVIGGIATPVGGDIAITAGSNMTTTAADAAVTIDLNDDVYLAGLLAADEVSITGLVGLTIGTGNINLISGDLTVTLGSIDINNGDLNVGDHLTVGGTIDFTDYGAGILRTSAAGDVTSTNGAAGEVLIGGGAAPVWATLTEGANVTITNNDNAITISATGGGGGSGATTFITDLFGPAMVDGVDITLTGGNVLETEQTPDLHTVTTRITKGGVGQVIIGGGTGALDPEPGWYSLTQGAGITITPAANEITISATGGGGGNSEVGMISRFDGTLSGGSAWLRCNGNSVSIAAYPALYAAIGHEYFVPTFADYGVAFNTVYAVAHNKQAGANGLWCAVGSANQISTSPDGINWTPRVGPFGGTDIIGAIAHNGQAAPNGLWMACTGFGTGYSYPNAAIATSADGITWALTGSTLTYNANAIIHNQLAAPNGRWLATSYGGKIYYSDDDGATWAIHSAPTTGSAYYSPVYNATTGRWACYQNSTISGGGTNYGQSNVSYSDDGITWTAKWSYYEESRGDRYAYLSGLSIIDDTFVLSGTGIYGGSQFYTSQDALFFETESFKIGGSQYGFASLYGYPYIIGNDAESVYMTVKDTNRLYRTIDGKQWDLIDNSFATTSATRFASNMQAMPDNEISIGGRYLGKSAIVTTTDFYLPNIPGYIILAS